MSPKKKKKKTVGNNSTIKNQENRNRENKNVLDRDVEEADKIIAHLDEIEKKKQEEMASKVKQLIASDKEAIKKMEEDDSKSDNSSENKNPTVESGKGKRNKKKKKHISDNKQVVKKKQEDFDLDEDDLDEEELEEKELDIPDFVNMESNATVLRKSNPNKLKDNTKNPALKYYIAGGVVIVALVLGFVAMILNGGAKKPDQKKPDEAFIQDNVNTTEMTELVNHFYEKLDADDMDGAKQFLCNSENLSDQEMKDTLNMIKNQVALNKKLTGTSQVDFSGCYVQDGMNPNEYIVYMKFDMHISGVDTPAPGIYSFYIRDDIENLKQESQTTESVSEKDKTTDSESGQDKKETEEKETEEKETEQEETEQKETEQKESEQKETEEKETEEKDTKQEEKKSEETTANPSEQQTAVQTDKAEHNYKIVLIPDDSDSQLKKYMDDMRKSSGVQELFTRVEKEYKVACSTDEDLKKIVEALNNKSE